MNRATGSCGAILEGPTQTKLENHRRQGKGCKKTVSKNVPNGKKKVTNLMTDINLQIPEPNGMLNKTNSKKTIPMQIIMKWEKKEK